MAQMAATAGSVAVGSTIGHGISNLLFGGSSHAPAPEAAAPIAQAQAPAQQQSYAQGISCEVQAKGKPILFTSQSGRVLNCSQISPSVLRRQTFLRARGISNSSRP